MRFKGTFHLYLAMMVAVNNRMHLSFISILLKFFENTFDKTVDIQKFCDQKRFCNKKY